MANLLEVQNDWQSVKELIKAETPEMKVMIHEFDMLIINTIQGCTSALFSAQYRINEAKRKGNKETEND